MAVYADSSLLIKLYIREPESPDAVAAVQSLKAPLVYTPLHKLEILGAIRCNVRRGTLEASNAACAIRLLREDLRRNVYSFPELDWRLVFDRAHRLSQRHSRLHLARSLDLLHVASALELRSSDFLSFDHRQREVALAEGMNLIP